MYQCAILGASGSRAVGLSDLQTESYHTGSSVHCKLSPLSFRRPEGGGIFAFITARFLASLGMTDARNLVYTVISHREKKIGSISEKENHDGISKQ